MMKEFKDIIFDCEGGVATVTLNRRDIRNAVTGRVLIEEMEEVCSIVNRDMTVKVLVITGVDPVFSSGGNVKDMVEGRGMFGGTSQEIMENYRRSVQRIPLALFGVEVPTIAAVNGPAVGAGCDLALMCDMRIASEKARFGETFLSLGLISGDGGAYFLPRAVGMAKACELTFTGDIVDAPEALRMGMINRVVPHDRLMEETLFVASKIAAKPAHALRMAKRLLYTGQRGILVDILEQSAAYQSLCHKTAEHADLLSNMLKG